MIYNEQTDNTTEELTEALIERAKKGLHSKFIFIRSLKEWLIAKDYTRSSRHVAKQFSKMAKNLTKTYIASIKGGLYPLDIILAIKNCEEIAKFYQEEANIVKDTIKEYHTYVISGHILSTLLGEYREDEDLIDYRTLPIKWF